MYNFDIIPDRSKTNSLKWMFDGVTPLWVGDMDFDTLIDIKEAIINRINIGAFGYTNTPEYYFDAYINFWKRRHDIVFDRNWMIFCTGVVPAISSIVRKVTKIEDKVMVMTPTYNIFFNSIVNNNRIPIQNDLKVDEFGKYNIDFVDFENKIKGGVKLLILCNPQNPVGRIWTKEELSKIVNICKMNNCLILSDEIHADVMKPGEKYVPILSINEAKDISIVCISASKCFNLAGLQGSCVIVPNFELRIRVDRGLNTDEVAEGNVFVYDGITAALNKGDIWLDEMNEYVYENKKYLDSFLKENIPEFKYTISPATFFAWVDISKLTNNSLSLCNYLKDKFNVYFSFGDEYGTSFNGFIRINVATSRKILEEGLRKLKLGVDKYKEDNNI